jgi:flagellar hook-length control protein FliK
MHQYSKMAGELDKALFFLLNGMVPTKKAMGILSATAEGAHAMVKEIQSLMEAIESIPDPELREMVKSVLGYGEEGILEEKLGNLSMHDTNANALKKAQSPIPEFTPKAESGMQSPKGASQANAQSEDVSLKDKQNHKEALPRAAQAANGSSLENGSGTKGNPRLEVAPSSIESRMIQGKDNLASLQSNVSQQPELGNRKAMPKGAQGSPTANSLAFVEKLAEHAEREMFANRHGGSASEEAMIQGNARNGASALRMRRFALPKGLTLNGLGDSPKELDDFLKGMSMRLEEAKEILGKHPDGQKALDEAVRLQDRLGFLAEVKLAAAVQLPLTINGNLTPAEIFVFRDKKKKSPSKASTALLALDTAHLGRFEAYIQKSEDTVTLVFRLENEEVEELVKSCTNELASLLADSGLRLSGFSFRQLDKPFTLLGREEDVCGTCRQKGPYVIDARV